MAPRPGSRSCRGCPFGSSRRYPSLLLNLLLTPVMLLLFAYVHGDLTNTGIGHAVGSVLPCVMHVVLIGAATKR